MFFRAWVILMMGGAFMKKKDDIPERYPAGSLLRVEQEVIISDPLGSYTGVTQDSLEKPIQDADDL